MKLSTIVTRALVLALIVAPTASAMNVLDDYLKSIDVQASADLGSFKADLSLTFGVDDGKVDGLFRIMSKPSDVYMCLRVGEVAEQPIERVVEEYNANKGQGWGVIAKNLGIKPGSDEFHALKSGKMISSGGSSNNKGKGGKGKK